MYVFDKRDYELYDEPFFGFAKGKYDYDEGCREELFIPESFILSGFGEFVCECIGKFEHYGYTEVSKSQWEKLKKKSGESNEVVQGIIHELDSWATENFKQHRWFTILGI